MQRLLIFKILAACLVLVVATREDRGWSTVTVQLVTIDGSTGHPTPARIEVRGENGKYEIASDAMHVGVALHDDAQPLTIADPAQYISTLRQRFRNYYSQSDQFYSSGQCTLQLIPGAYEVKAFKGIEYVPVSQRIQVEAGSDQTLELRVRRWINMPEEGWYSADDHLHIPRPVPELNDHLLKWMEAEDLHVANLLQWGHSHHVNNAFQYAHGKPGVYQSGNYILASGQEAPRTPILGHTIMLGTAKPIHLPDRYLLYRDAFAEGRRQGTVNGYAHHGIFFHAQNGLAFDLTTGLVDFIEVLQGGTADYSAWYLALNSGFRLTPLAGTDFPVGPIPGWDRFYASIQGTYTFETWLDAVRKGRIFVTNGPILNFSVENASMGGELALDAPREVWIAGSVRFNPESDDVQKLELVRTGEVIAEFPRNAGATGEIKFRIRRRIDEACWLALRASGFKKNEMIPVRLRRQSPHSGPTGTEATWTKAPALAHTSPVYVTVRGLPSLAESSTGKTATWAWLARLRDFESTLRDIRLQEMADDDENTTWDAVSMDLLKANRPALLEAILEAERQYIKRAAQTAGQTTSSRYRVLIVIAPGYQEHELWFAYYRFREEGADVLLAAPEKGTVYGAGLHGKDGLPAVVAATIEDALQKPFDVLYIPGGLWAATKLRGHPPTLDLLRRALKEKKVVATVGHAAWILISAYQAKGRTIAGPLEIAMDIHNAGAYYVANAAVRDDNLVTAVGPDDLPDFFRLLLPVIHEKVREK
jgi:putative intracellular protease/amidase